MGYMLLGTGGIIAAPFVLPVIVEGAVIATPYVANGATHTGRFAWSAAKTYHNTFGMKGGYVNMAWNAGSQGLQWYYDTENYKVDFLALTMNGFIISPTPLAAGTPLWKQSLIGVSTSFVNVNSGGVVTKGLTKSTTATSINGIVSVSYSNSIYGNNFSALIINNGVIQPIINFTEKKE